MLSEFEFVFHINHNLSQRVMTALEEMTPRVEQYSIDEMFLDLTGINGCEDYEHFGRRLWNHVLNTTGLPVSVGMVPTKTLAKSAQWASKKWKQFRGVLALTPDNPKRTVRELNGESFIPIEELPPAKQQICCSRSFGERITAKVAMQQALCHYATRAAEKLRGERQFCRRISVFIRTSPHAVNEVFYGNSAGEKLSPAWTTRWSDISVARVL